MKGGKSFLKVDIFIFDLNKRIISDTLYILKQPLFLFLKPTVEYSIQRLMIIFIFSILKKSIYLHIFQNHICSIRLDPRALNMRL